MQLPKSEEPSKSYVIAMVAERLLISMVNGINVYGDYKNPSIAAVQAIEMAEILVEYSIHGRK